MKRHLRFADYAHLLQKPITVVVTFIVAIIAVWSAGYEKIALIMMNIFMIVWMIVLMAYKHMVSRLSSDRDFIWIDYWLWSMKAEPYTLPKSRARLEIKRDRWLILRDGKRRVAQMPLFDRNGESLTDPLRAELAGSADDAIA
jgi:hypothetical protein